MNEDKFNGMGGIYQKFRPSYPQEFIDYLYTEVGVTDKSVIADVGSGTGIFTKLLLERGNTVYSVEPNADMSAVAKSNLSGYDGFIPVSAAAEDTTLDPSSVDYITVAQAFHWFGRQRFKAECQRILKPNGMVILVWNSRDNKSELVIENDRINKSYCSRFKGFSGGMRGATGEGDFNDFFSGSYQSKVINNPIVFDEQGFIGRNLSASYALKEDEAGYKEYVSALKALFYRYSTNGILTMPNLTRSYVGRV